MTETLNCTRLLRNALTATENGSDLVYRSPLLDQRDAMLQMRTGDGSDPTHYAAVQLLYGFVDDDTAKAAFDELAAACGTLENGSATGAQIQAALNQLFSRFRG